MDQSGGIHYLHILSGPPGSIQSMLLTGPQMSAHIDPPLGRPTPCGARSVGPHVFASGTSCQPSRPGHESINTSLGGFQVTHGAAVPDRPGQVVGFNGGGLCPEEKDGLRMEVGAYGLCSIQEACWSPRNRTPTPSLIKAAFVSHVCCSEPIYLAFWRRVCL